jgi:hypothetical protein
LIRGENQEQTVMQSIKSADGWNHFIEEVRAAGMIYTDCSVENNTRRTVFWVVKGENYP